MEWKDDEVIEVTVDGKYKIRLRHWIAQISTGGVPRTIERFTLEKDSLEDLLQLGKEIIKASGSGYMDWINAAEKLFVLFLCPSRKGGKKPRAGVGDPRLDRQITIRDIKFDQDLGCGKAHSREEL